MVNYYNPDFSEDFHEPYDESFDEDSEKRECYEMERCPGKNLETCLSWLDVKKFGLLRAYEPQSRDSLKARLEKKAMARGKAEVSEEIITSVQQEEIETYKRYQEISLMLFKFLHPDLREFSCHDRFFETARAEEFKRREDSSNEIEKFMREYIIAELADHVRRCEKCLPEYNGILKRLAEERLPPGYIDSIDPLESDFSRGMRIAEKIIDFDNKLLGLFQPSD